MTVSVKVNLSENVAAKAKAKGLLEPEAVSRLIERELQLEEPIRAFREMVQELRAHPDEPMTMDEIQAEVTAVRAARRGRGEGNR